MVIRSSTAAEVARLIAELESPSETRREAAVARLAIIGPRAVERLIALLRRPAAPVTHAAAVRALEGIGDPRALESALPLLRSPDPVLALPVVSLARAHLASPLADIAATALDHLTAVALDSACPDTVRVAAAAALQEIRSPALEPVLSRLQADADPAVRISTVAAAHGPAAAVERIAAAARGDLPAAPADLAELLGVGAGSTPLPVLHRLVATLRSREASEPDTRAEWMAVRAAVHQALAERQSRIALYDLRETVAAADRLLPLGFLAATAAVGDASCLEAIAAAHDRAAGDDWWRGQLAAALGAILRRERLTRRHPAVRRILARWPASGTELLARARQR